MKDTRYLFLVLLSSLLLVLAGCSRRDVLDDYPVSGVEVKLNWNGVTDKLPEGVRIIFYPKNAEGRKIEKYLSVNGGEVKVPPGRYAVVIYNFDTETVRIRGEEAYETIEAYTGNCWGLGIAETEKMVWGPDPLYVVNIDNLEVAKSDKTFVLEVKPELAIRTYTFSIKAEGLKNVSTIIGCVEGMAECYCIGLCCSMCRNTPVYFEARKGDGAIEGSFTTFGTHEMQMNRAEYTNLMKLILVKIDKSVQEVKIDITDLVEDSSDVDDPSEEIELPIEDEIKVDDVEGGGDDGGGGMDGNVDGWGDGEDVEIPVG